MSTEQKLTSTISEQKLDKTAQEEPQILEEITIEELSIDGICGVY